MFVSPTARPDPACAPCTQLEDLDKVLDRLSELADVSDTVSARAVTLGGQPSTDGAGPSTPELPGQLNQRIARAVTIADRFERSLVDARDALNKVL